MSMTDRTIHEMVNEIREIESVISGLKYAKLAIETARTKKEAILAISERILWLYEEKDCERFALDAMCEKIQSLQGAMEE